MESRLINAKANWADSEHERELIQNKLQEINNLINDKIEGGIQALYNLQWTHLILNILPHFLKINSNYRNAVLNILIHQNHCLKHEEVIIK